MYKIILYGISITLLLSACQVEGDEKRERQNILVIVADDLGWSDLGTYGNTFIETPNLDALAERGLRFSNAYAPASLCSPSRASIMTGLHPVTVNITEHIHGNQPPGPNRKLATPFIDQQLSADFKTTAEYLQDIGYQTAYFGKWHLGGGKAGPEYRGFDTTFAAGANGLPNSFFYPFFQWGIRDIQTVADTGDYLTDVLTTQAIDWLNTTDSSFLMYLNYYSPHVPIEAPEDIVSYYLDKAGHIGEAHLPNPHYAAMVTSIDQNIGRIIDALETSGRLANTTVIFTSDNGGLSVKEVPAFAKHTPPTDNAPLRAGKGYLYEGGIRVPLIIHSPGKAEQGTVVDRPAVGTDIHATVVELAGIDTTVAQGQSLLADQRADRALYWHVPHYSPQGGKPSSAVRRGNFKLIYFYEEDDYELYDLAADPAEERDISETNPDVASGLLSLLNSWKVKMNAKEPSPNPGYEKH